MKKLIPYIDRLKQKWYWIALSTLVLGSLFLYQAATELPTFSTSISFVLNKEFTLPDRFLNRTLSSRRRKRISKRQQQNYSEQVIAYATSTPLMRKTLFKKVTMNGQIDFLANHIIEAYGIFNKENLKNPKLKPLIDFKFQHEVLDRFSITEQKAFRRLSRTVNNKRKKILTAVFDAKRELLIMSVESPYPDLPAILLNAIYANLEAHYHKQEFGTLYEQQKILTLKKAEYLQEMTELAPKLGLKIDQSGNYISKASQLPEKNLQQLYKRLSASYEKTFKLLFQIDMAMLQVVPILEIYHPPNAYPEPIYQYDNWWLAVIKGMGIGAIIAILIIVVSKGMQDFRTLLSNGKKIT